MVREGGIANEPGLAQSPPQRAGETRGRWLCHTRVQESEFDRGVAGRVVVPDVSLVGF